MLNVSTLLAGNLWTTLIDLFAKWIVNYGWAIIVFTICLKLVLSPLDIFQRVASSKQTRVMSAMQPELTAIQKKYANNKEKLNQETNNLYKKYNSGMGGMCIVMLVTMVLNLVILFTLYSTVRSYGNEKLYSSYQELEQSYIDTRSTMGADLTEEENTILVDVVKEKYEELQKQNGWLWVKNVWKGDKHNTSQFVDFDAYVRHYNITDETEIAEAQERYQFITSTIDGEHQQANGYYVLIVMAVVISFLTQFLSAKLMSPKGQKMNSMNKVMFAVVPVTMLILASTSNVIYTLYIIANSLMTAIISTIISLVLRKTNKKYEGKDGEILLKKKNVEVVEYSRNYKK